MSEISRCLTILAWLVGFGHNECAIGLEANPAAVDHSGPALTLLAPAKYLAAGQSHAKIVILDLECSAAKISADHGKRIIGMDEAGTRHGT